MVLLLSDTGYKVFKAIAFETSNLSGRCRVPGSPGIPIILEKDLAIWGFQPSRISSTIFEILGHAHARYPGLKCFVDTWFVSSVSTPVFSAV